MAPEEWKIRAAGDADVAAVLGLWQVAAGIPSATDTEPDLDRLLGHDPGALLVAGSGEAIVGTLIAAWDGWRGSFYRLAVDPSWRRRGVASSLVRAGEIRLEALGAVRLTAIVASDEVAARSLWQAMGYIPQAETSRFVRMLSQP
jgi:ribosomal protein S18 acetylase RimI-like enzyme